MVLTAEHPKNTWNMCGGVLLKKQVLLLSLLFLCFFTVFFLLHPVDFRKEILPLRALSSCKDLEDNVIFCVSSTSPRVENEEMTKKLDSTFYYRPRSFFFLINRLYFSLFSRFNGNRDSWDFTQVFFCERSEGQRKKSTIEMRKNKTLDRKRRWAVFSRSSYYSACVQWICH